MGKLRDTFLFPVRMAGAGARIGGRIAIGSVGFVLMAAGLLLTFDFSHPYLGVPIFLVGLLLLVKAIF